MHHGILAWTATRVAWAGLLMTGTALTLIAGATRLIGPSATLSLLLSLVVADQVSFGRNFRTMVPAAHVFPSVTEIDRIGRIPDCSAPWASARTSFRIPRSSMDCRMCAATTRSVSPTTPTCSTWRCRTCRRTSSTRPTVSAPCRCSIS